jgi:hypothetical protein
MKRHLIGVVVLAAIGLGGATASAQASDAADGKAVLDMLCRDKGGQPYFTPYTISRCQEARNKKGFAIEEIICEDLLGGSFAIADVPMRPNRSNWACVSGPADA